MKGIDMMGRSKNLSREATVNGCFCFYAKSLRGVRSCREAWASLLLGCDRTPHFSLEVL